jgi:hypothetical protein
MVQAVETGACGADAHYLRYRFLDSGAKATIECLYASDGLLWQQLSCGGAAPSCSLYYNYCGADGAAPAMTSVSCPRDAGMDTTASQ